jgi:hypothetical protein
LMTFYLSIILDLQNFFHWYILQSWKLKKPQIQLRPHHLWTNTSNLTTVVNSVLKFTKGDKYVIDEEFLYRYYKCESCRGEVWMVILLTLLLYCPCVYCHSLFVIEIGLFGWKRMLLPIYTSVSTTVNICLLTFYPYSQQCNLHKLWYYEKTFSTMIVNNSTNTNKASSLGYFNNCSANLIVSYPRMTLNC